MAEAVFTIFTVSLVNTLKTKNIFIVLLKIENKLNKQSIDAIGCSAMLSAVPGPVRTSGAYNSSLVTCTCTCICNLYYKYKSQVQVQVQVTSDEL